MAISVTCACGTRLQARDASAGKTVRCPKCGAGIEVPAAPAEVPAPEAAAERPAAARPLARRSVPARERSVRFGEESDGRDLRMEAHFRAIALWWRIYGLFALGIAALILILGLASDGVGRFAFLPMVLALAVLAGIGGLAFSVGFFLAKYSNIARLIAAALTILMMLGNVVQLGQSGGARNPVGALIGLAFGAAHLWAFFNRRGVAICESEYLERVAASAHLKVPMASSPFFWIPLVLIGLGLGLVLLAFAVLGSR